MRFNIGDVVIYVGTHPTWNTGNSIHIISEVVYRGNNDFEYATNRGAWFSTNDFKLKSKSTKKSLKKLEKDLSLE